MPEEYFSGIDDMILWNWCQCLEGNYNFARKKAIEGQNITDNDVVAWEKIYDDFIKQKGLNQLYKAYLKRSVDLAKAQIDYIITRKKNNLNLIRVYENDIERIKINMSSGMTTEQILIYIGRWYGSGILRAKDITVKEYLTLIDEYERANKTPGRI